jgi:hypothetical protein
MVEKRGDQAAAMPQGHIQHPHGQVQGRQGRHQGPRKPDHLEYQTEHSSFPESGQYLYS